MLAGSGLSGQAYDDARQSRAGAVLITGATGFVGMEVLVRYLERSDRRIFALVRAPSDRQARARMRRTLECLFGTDHPHARRVVAVRGDVTHYGLGIGRRRPEIAEQVEEIVHVAGTVAFDLPPARSLAVNADGTREVLELGRLCQAHGGLRRFSHVSTAYVAGDHRGRFDEDDLNVGQAFRNPYEQSKFEAECLVWAWRDRLPITILRPSIVVGERATGWTASFNVLYWPLRAFARGAYSALPARADAPVDVVPVDYVADAIHALAQAPEGEDAAFHLTAGPDATSVGELVRLASEYFQRSEPRLIDPLVYRRAVHPMLVRAARDERQRRALKRSELFFPYFAVRTRYDVRRARALLHSTAIRTSPLHEYFHRLVDFAVAADWGRREVTRARAAQEVAFAAAGRARVRSRRPALVPAA
jgi:thioester reductase-like protein